MGRRITEREEDLTRRDIERVVEAGEDLQEAALVSILYLTGARVSEALGVRGRDLTFESVSGGESQGSERVVIKLKTLKRWRRAQDGSTRRVLRWRRVPLSLERERVFLEPLLELWEQTPAEEPLFDFTRVTAWRKLKEAGRRVGLDIWCHLLRHLRSKELVEERGLSELELVRWHGWSSSQPAQTYVNLRWEDLARKV